MNQVAPFDTQDDTLKTQESLPPVHKMAGGMTGGVAFNPSYVDPELTDATPAILEQRYAYLRLLGEGAAGKTYKAYDKLHGRIVAIKALRLNVNFKTRELFDREVATLQSLNTPGIPDFYELIVNPENDAEVYLVQEFFEGISLQKSIDNRSKIAKEIDGLIPAGSDDLLNPVFSLKEIQQCIRDIGNILKSLQTDYIPPIIHRDIKPSNILCYNKRYYLIDFGAVANPQRKSLNSTIAGTQGYMAPEQLIGDCTIQSDYYGLGATILHMITGISPADIPTDGFVRLYDPIIERYALPTELKELLKLLLAPKAEDRPKSAQDILNIVDKMNTSYEMEPVGNERGIAMTDKINEYFKEHPKRKRPLCIPITLFFMVYYIFNTISSVLLSIFGITQYDPSRQHVSSSANLGIARVKISWWRIIFLLPGSIIAVSILISVLFSSSGFFSFFAHFLSSFIFFCGKFLPFLIIPCLIFVFVNTFIVTRQGKHQYEFLHMLNRIYEIPQVFLPFYLCEYKGKNKEKVDAKVRAVYQRVYSSFGTQRTVLYVNYTYEYKGISYAHWCTIPDNSCRQSFAKAQRNNDPSIKGETTYFSALQSLTLTMSIDPSAPSFHKVAKEQPSFFAKQISKNLVKALKSEYELSYAGAF